MSDDLSKRLSTVEAGHTELRSDFRLLNERVGGLASQVTKIGTGVEGIHDLLARRGEPTNFRAVIATVLSIGAAIGMVAGFVYWFMATSPPIQQLERRVTKIDDPEYGHLKRIEDTQRRSGLLKGWEVVDGGK